MNIHPAVFLVNEIGCLRMWLSHLNREAGGAAKSTVIPASAGIQGLRASNCPYLPRRGNHRKTRQMTPCALLGFSALC